LEEGSAGRKLGNILVTNPQAKCECVIRIFQEISLRTSNKGGRNAAHMGRRIEYKILLAEYKELKQLKSYLYFGSIFKIPGWIPFPLPSTSLITVPFDATI
jgi:hypothetical protein